MQYAIQHGERDCQGQWVDKDFCRVRGNKEALGLHSAIGTARAVE